MRDDRIDLVEEQLSEVQGQVEGSIKERLSAIEREISKCLTAEKLEERLSDHTRHSSQAVTEFRGCICLLLFLVNWSLNL